MSDHCKDCCCAQSWTALGITDYDGKSIPEHIRELRAERDRLKAIIAQAAQHIVEDDPQEAYHVLYFSDGGESKGAHLTPRLSAGTRIEGWAEYDEDGQLVWHSQNWFRANKISPHGFRDPAIPAVLVLTDTEAPDGGPEPREGEREIRQAVWFACSAGREFAQGECDRDAMNEQVERQIGRTLAALQPAGEPCRDWVETVRMAAQEAELDEALGKPWTVEKMAARLMR